MLGLVKLLTVAAASLLVFDALASLDLSAHVHDPGLLSAIDLIRQGQRQAASVFERAPWFPSAPGDAVRIEAAAAALGAVGLVIAKRLTISEFLGKVGLATIGLGGLFFLAGPGGQIAAGHLRQLADAGGAAARQLASEGSASVGAAADGLPLDPGEWRVTSEGVLNGSPTSMTQNRCITPDMIRQRWRPARGS